MRHKLKAQEGVSTPLNPHLERLHNYAMEKKSRLIRAQQEKDRMEVEQAIALS